MDSWELKVDSDEGIENTAPSATYSCEKPQRLLKNKSRVTI